MKTGRYRILFHSWLCNDAWK